MAIDSHTHINHLLVNDIEREILDITLNKNIEKVINVGLNINTSLETLKISRNNSKFYSAVGIHPLYIDNEDPSDLYDMAKDEKVVAIGEIGLDNLKDNFEMQKKYLLEQISIANELNLPIIIHSNNSNKFIIELFEKNNKPKYGCVFHCFQPDMEDLKYLIKNNFYISFAGRVTYKTAKKSIEVAKAVPNDLFLVETDSPYISPEPNKDEVNHPSNIKYIIEKIASIKEKSYEEIENITQENAKKLFKQI